VTAQSHFIDLCRLLDQPGPTEADPTGDRYTLNKGATKAPGPTTSKRGWADLWKKGCFAWEYKGPHANLDKAYRQLQKYRESLENPRCSWCRTYRRSRFIPPSTTVRGGNLLHPR
jgi:hypothetical protein